MSMSCCNRTRRAAWIALAVLAIAIGTPCAQSQPESGRTTPWYETISIHAFVSSGYSYNFNTPDTMKNQFHVFDFDDNSIKIDVIELSASREPGAGEAGFRCDLTAGSSVPRVIHSSGLDLDDIDFHQIYLSYAASIGNGLRVDIGKFITSMGYEVIEGYDGYNDNYTRSFLFGYAIPYTHTGVRITYPLSDRCTAMASVVNGWDNAVDNNKSKSVCCQLSGQPAAGLSLSANYMIGPERDQNDANNRQSIDVTGIYAASQFLTLGINGDYSAERGATPMSPDVDWKGLAGYLRLNITGQFSFCVRAEQFEDPEGVRTGVGQTLREITVTPEFRPAPHVVVRGDLRLDHSNRDVFQKGSGVSNTQTTVSINALVLF